MKKIEQINSILKRVLSTNDIYKSDWYLCVDFISKRNFQGLQEMVKSILKMEENKPKNERLVNYSMLVESMVLINEYVEQLEYNPETNGEFDD